MSVVGSTKQAIQVARDGADVVIAQGTEGGGHTGHVGTMALLPQVLDAVDVPVVAAGGIGDGRGLAAALVMGCQAVWVGTRFLATVESGLAGWQKAELLAAADQSPVISRAYTGKRFRLLPNRWTEAWEQAELDPLPMPLQPVLTGDDARRHGDRSRRTPRPVHERRRQHRRPPHRGAPRCGRRRADGSRGDRPPHRPMSTHTPPFVRTPDANFDALVDFAFEPRYLDIDGLRMHYVDEGPPGGPVALMVHGMPTWSYLYRKVIVAMRDAGYRCIAPDHIGFGRSDKVTDPSWYDIARHTANLTALVQIARPPRHHPVRAGLGWPHRARAGRRHARTVLASRDHEHLAAPRRLRVHARHPELDRAEPARRPVPRQRAGPLRLGHADGRRHPPRRPPAGPAPRTPRRGTVATARGRSGAAPPTMPRSQGLANPASPARASSPSPSPCTTTPEVTATRRKPTSPPSTRRRCRSTSCGDSPTTSSLARGAGAGTRSSRTRLGTRSTTLPTSSKTPTATASPKPSSTGSAGETTRRTSASTATTSDPATSRRGSRRSRTRR